MKSDNFMPITGKRLKEDGTTFNEADLIHGVSDTVTIATTQSGVIDKRGKMIGAIEMDTWTAADITFLGCSTSNGTFRPVYDGNGIEATVVVGTGARMASCDNVLAVLAPIPYIKLRSGHVGVEVTQAAERTLKICWSR